MNVSALIDAIVRQTTVLIAQLATLEGGRAQLAHTANQVFLDLSTALREQGVGSKVVADMFGLALRTYQERVRRLSESRTVRGRSLWEAILEHIEAHGPIVRAEVLARFAYDDLAAVRSVLRDLVNNGVVYRTGRGDQTVYRVATEEEMHAPLPRGDESVCNLVWVAVQRKGRARRSELIQALSLDGSRLDNAIATLLERNLIEAHDSSEGTIYESHGFVLPYEDPRGWEAAVFDHFQAVVIALCTKLRLGQTRATPNETVGGSTFGFVVWPGHPEYDDAMGLLSEFRARAGELRRRVGLYNETHDVPLEQKRRIVTYVGQTIIDTDTAAPENESDDENSESD